MLNEGTSFLALNKNEEIREQNNNLEFYIFETAELLSF
jgi:hypothetical protein